MAELKHKLASTIDTGQERIIGNDEADSSILSSGTISSFKIDNLDARLNEGGFIIA